MSIQPKPIPPLYTVYILRSTVRHASLYIGSTPNPPRRLKQHNGGAKGGAVRTSRTTLRPWEMVGLVSGFPGMVAALKFEWALSNPHVSLHIPSNTRLTIASQRKRNGQPKRPPHSLTSILANVHLLLRVPSFSRWPLKLHFFAPEVFKAWEKWCETANEPIRASIPVVTDFKPPQHMSAPASSSRAGSAKDDGNWGIHALPLDYRLMKDYVAKTQTLYAFQREGDCVVCGEQLPPGGGLYATCSTAGCEATGHVSCWSRHMLGCQNQNQKKNDDDDVVIPISGRCPRCRGEVLWGDMIKEMSLRVRGRKEVDKLLKKPRKRKAKHEIEDSDA